MWQEGQRRAAHRRTPATHGPHRDTDLWILQYRLPDWSKAIVSYGFVGGELKTGDSFKPRIWRGSNAPIAPEVETLKGQNIPCTIHSAALGEDRKFTVYMPPNAPKKGLPAFFVCDGAGEGFIKALEASILAGEDSPVRHRRDRKRKISRRPEPPPRHF